MTSSDSDSSSSGRRSSKRGKSSRERKRSRERRGKRSRDRRSRSRSKGRRSSRERSSYHHRSSRDRRRSKSPDPKMKKDTKKSIEATKEKMRQALSSADESMRKLRGESVQTVSAEAVRQQEISRIDDGGGFTPAFFVSSRSRPVVETDSFIPEATLSQSKHDEAIYGELNSRRTIKQEEDEEVDVKPDVKPLIAQPEPKTSTLLHEKLFENPEVRKKRWEKIWNAQRKKLMEKRMTQVRVA